MYFHCCLITDGGGFCQLIEVAKMALFSFHSNVCSPFVFFITPDHSYIARFVIGSFRSVSLVLRVGSPADIESAIIKCVPILVVAFLFPFQFQECAMHKNRVPAAFASFTVSCRVKASRRRQRVPIPLIKPIIISGINQSILTFRERDNSIGWILRLDNCVTLHAAFHRSTSNGSLIPAAY